MSEHRTLIGQQWIYLNDDDDSITIEGWELGSDGARHAITLVTSHENADALAAEARADGRVMMLELEAQLGDDG